MMHLLRCLFFMVAHLHIQVKATHVAGVSNVAADALFCNDLSRFLQVVPEAAKAQTPIPVGLVDLLVQERPDWTSPRSAQAGLAASMQWVYNSGKKKYLEFYLESPLCLCQSRGWWGLLHPWCMKV